MSAYPWIEIYRVTRPSRVDMGWIFAECNRCGRGSSENAEPYTEDWMHEHAQKCHPRWAVRKGDCQFCMARAAEREDSNYTGRGIWIVTDSHGSQFGCRQEFDEAIKYAQRQAAKFLRGELKWLGADG